MPFDFRQQSDYKVNKPIGEQPIQAMPSSTEKSKPVNPAKPFVLAGFTILLFLIFAVDFATGSLIGFAGYYMLLVIATVWYVGAGMAYLFSALSVVSMILVVEYAPPYGIFKDFSFFLKCIDITSKGISVFLGCYLGIKFKEEMEILHKMSQTDSLMGTVLSEVFRERVATEMVRSERYARPLTLVYFDIDKFKEINDAYGHGTGGNVLKKTAEVVNSSLRKHDALGRMGGDEFAILLVETGYEEAKRIVERIQEDLLEAMLKFKTAITFSFGVVTYLGKEKIDVNSLEKQADTLMYSVKNTTRNDIRYKILK